jgi:hypothetical protein
MGINVVETDESKAEVSSSQYRRGTGPIAHGEDEGAPDGPVPQEIGHDCCGHSTDYHGPTCTRPKSDQYGGVAFTRTSAPRLPLLT